MTSVCQIAPYFLPILVWVHSGLPAPTSPHAERYLGDGGTAGHRTSVTPLADSQSEISARPLVAPAQASGWLLDAAAKIEQYAVLADDWKGLGSLAPKPDTLEQAIELASQFAYEIPGVSAPIVGADDEGAITFLWISQGMTATVTAHGDSTYSYYAEKQDAFDRSDSEPIGEPLPRALVEIMAVDASLSLLVA